MSHDDPFALPESERTLMVPSPGGRGAQTRYSPMAETDPLASLDPAIARSGMNPLLAAANKLLAMVPRIRSTAQHPDPQALKEGLARDIKDFEHQAQAANIPSERIVAARYALCTVLDEAAGSTPWGSAGAWAKNSLLIMFHNEAWGGEKFFQLLARLAENPSANLELLQLLYVCLALGFEGRYRVLEDGKAQLGAVRERLAGLIRRQQGEYERDLSPHWQVSGAKRQNPLFILPTWLTAGIFGLLLLGAYLGFSYFLNTASDRVFANIQAIRVASAAPRREPPPGSPRLAPLLARDIAERNVVVRENETRSTVTISNDRLFAPGSASLSPEFAPLFERIADALNAIPGQILVTGHTDNQPIHTARFPSNWDLSDARAHSVMQLLAAKVAPANRMHAEGRADTEPIAANDTSADRARNRRVEITLATARAQPARK